VNTFAKRLKDTRKERKLSQAKLARLCGLSQSAIANYEGQTRSNPKDVFRIAEALGVSADWLARGTLPKEPMNYVFMDPNRLDTVEPKAADGIYAWPFGSVSPAEVWAIDPENRRILEDTMRAMLNRMNRAAQ
jgi:transcriptional regulator with XRE-family HTH domain